MGAYSDPLGALKLSTFGDKCPTCELGIAVHEAVIPMLDEVGDIVLPQHYAICCECHKRDYVRKYGAGAWSPCVDDEIQRALDALFKGEQPPWREPVGTVAISE